MIFGGVSLWELIPALREIMRVRPQDQISIFIRRRIETRTEFPSCEGTEVGCLQSGKGLSRPESASILVLDFSDSGNARNGNLLFIPNPLVFCALSELMKTSVQSVLPGILLQ